MSAAVQRVRLGAIEVDLRAGELQAAGKTIRLQQQPLQILLTLIEYQGEVVTREELKKKLWPNNTVVDFDHSINSAIKKLRQALNDSADDPKYVETVGRRGYRLLATVLHVVRIGESAAEPARDVNEELRPDPHDQAPGETELVVHSQPEPNADSRALVGKEIAHYRVLDVLEKGGMGTVYRAEDLNLRRQVALKFLPEDLAWDPAALGRFKREARTLSMLDHPNICTLYEVEQHQGQPYLVMQLLQGETLRERLATLALTCSKLPLHELLVISEQVCDGLQAAHNKNIIHRDIKPANIFLTSSGQVKILDFGLAKVVDKPKDVANDSVQFESTEIAATELVRSHLSHIGFIRCDCAVGTMGYMSPEQIRGEKLDTRSDLFCLGLVLYEMTTGQRAFNGDPEFIQSAILKDSLPSARDLNPMLPSLIEAIIAKALKRNREHRYQSADELRGDLELVRKGQSEAPNRFHKWLSRRVEANAARRLPFDAV